MNPLSQLIEAALFSAPRPLTVEELATLDAGATLADARAALDELKELLDFGQHGVELVEMAGGWQILTRPALAEAIERAQFAVRTPRLTGAARSVSSRSGARGAAPAGRAANRRRTGQQDFGPVRQWAKANGYQVSERGRVPASVLEAYEAAH